MKYERCSGRHVGGDSCTSEVGHKGPCTFGLDIEPKRAPSSVSAGAGQVHADAIEKAREVIGLLRSIILSGERFSERAERVVQDALAALAAVDAPKDDEVYFD